MSSLAAELLGAGVLTAIFFAIIATAEIWSRRGTPSPETTRKFVHLGSGLACLTFPFLLSSPFTVLAMAAGMTLFFRIAAYFEFLESVHGIDRTSRGSEYYPLAIFLVFLLAGDQPWVYVASVLILGVADAFAALVGSRYGRLRYTVQEDRKSVEGSTVFFLIAVAAIVLPGWALGPEPTSELALSAIIGAALLTGFEAISLQGADNLFVPVAGCVILEKQAMDSYSMLVDQALLLAGLFIGLVVINQLTRYWGSRRQTAVNTGGTIASAMFAYAVWTLGGFDWAAPVLVVFGLFIATWMAVALIREARRKIAVRTTYRALLAPFTILVFANTFDWYDFLYGPFLASCASILSYGAWNRIRGNTVPVARRRPMVAAVAVALAGSGAVVGTALLLQADAPLNSALFILALTGPFAALNSRLVEHWDVDPRESMWPGPSFHLTALHASAVLLAQHLEWIGIWRPSLWN